MAEQQYNPFGVPESDIDSVLAPGIKEEERQQRLLFNPFGVSEQEIDSVIVSGNGDQPPEPPPGQGASEVELERTQTTQEILDQVFDRKKITETPDQTIPITEIEDKKDDRSNDLVTKPAEQLLEEETNLLTDEEEFNVWYQGWQNQINEHYKQRDIRTEDGSLFQMGGPDFKMAPYPSEPDNLIQAYDYKAAYKDDVEPMLQKHKNGKHYWHWPSKYKNDSHPNRFIGADTYLNEYKKELMGEQKTPTKIKKLLYDIHLETGGRMEETQRNTVLYKWLQANGVDPKGYDPEYKAPVGYKTSEYAAKVRSWRTVNRDNTLMEDYNPELGEESSVLLEQSDNLVYPTLFPINPNSPSSDPSAWMELSGEAAYKEAEMRGEVLEFRSDNEAMAFAESKGSGDWESVPETKEVGYVSPTMGKPRKYKSAFAEKILAYDSKENKWVVDPHIGYDDFQAPSLDMGYYDEKSKEWVNPEITRSMPDGWDRRTSNMSHEEHLKSIDYYDNADKDMYIPFQDITIPINLLPPDLAGKQYKLNNADDYKQFYYASGIDALSKHYDLPEVYFSQDDVDAYAEAHSLNLGQATVAAINSSLSSITLGITENLWDPTANQDVVAKHKQVLPYSKEGQGWPKIQRSLFAVGHTGAEVAAYLGPTKAFGLLKLKKVPVGYAAIMRSAMVFGSVGGGRRVFDPDEREHLTLEKWMVGTALDTALGAAFPFMGRLGGEVLKTPNTYRAVANYMVQTGVLTGGMTAVGFADGLHSYMDENPNKTFAEAFKAVGNDVIDGEKLFQSFMTMAVLHGLGAGPRFMKGGKLKAEELNKLHNAIGMMWDTAPFDIKKKPTTVPEMVDYQEKYNLWVESRGNKGEYEIQNGNRIKHDAKREALNEQRLADRNYLQPELDAMEWNNVWDWAKERQHDYFRHKGILYKVEMKYPRPVIKTLNEATSHLQWIGKEKQKVQMELEQFQKSGRVNKNLLGDRTIEKYESDLYEKMSKLNAMEGDVNSTVTQLKAWEKEGKKGEKVIVQEEALKEDLDQILEVVEPPKKVTSQQITEGKGLGDNAIKLLENLTQKGKEDAMGDVKYELVADAEMSNLLTQHIKEKFEAMTAGKPQIIERIKASKLPDEMKRDILGEWYDVRIEKPVVATAQKEGEARAEEISEFTKEGIKKVDKPPPPGEPPTTSEKIIKEFDAGKRELWELTIEERGLTESFVPGPHNKEHRQAVLDALGRGEDVRQEVLDSFRIKDTGASIKEPLAEVEAEPVIQPGVVEDYRKDTTLPPDQKYELLRKGRVQTLDDIAGEKLTKTDNNIFEATHQTIQIKENKKGDLDLTFGGKGEPYNKVQREWVQKSLDRGILRKVKDGYELTKKGEALYDQGQVNKAVHAAGITPTEYDTQVKPGIPKTHRGSQLPIFGAEDASMKETDLFRVKGKGGDYTNISQGHYVILSSKGNKPLKDALDKLGEGKNDIGPFKDKKALSNIQPSKNNEVGNEGVIVGYNKSSGKDTGAKGDWLTWLTDGQGNVAAVNSKYIDMFKKFFGPDITFNMSKTKPNVSALTVFNGQGKEVGFVMPVRAEISEAPPNIKGYLSVEQGKAAYNNPFLAKGGSGKGGLGSKKFEREDKVGSPNDNFEMADLHDPVKREDIGLNLVKQLSLGLGDNIRFKKIKWWRRKGAVAMFFPKSDIIRVNSLKDVDDLSHEIGHYLDLSLFGITETMRVKGYDQLSIQVKKWRNMKDGPSKNTKMTTLVNKYGQDAVNRWKERLEVQDELIEFLKKRHYPELTVEEGIAEFVSDYVTNPKNASKEAPKFFEMFEGIIEHTPIKGALLDARKQMEGWEAQDVRVQMESTIHRTGEDSWLEGIVNEVYGSYFNLVDFTQPLRRVTAEYLKDNPDAKGHEMVINQFLSNLGSEGKAQQFLDNHPFSVNRRTGEITIREDIPGLMKTLQPWIGKGGTRLKALEGYLVALRNIELHGRYKGQAATLGLKKSEQVRDLWEQEFPEIKETAQDIYRYQDALLDYYKDSGMLSNTDVENIREVNQFYIPFNRWLHGREMYDMDNPGGKYSMSQFLADKSYQKVMGIKGAKEDVLPPLEQIISNTFQLIGAADMNATKVTLVNNLMLTGKGSGVQKIPNSKLVVTVQKDPITKEVINRIYQYRKVPIEGPGMITMRVNGDIGYYEVTPDVFKAFSHLNSTTSKYLKVMALPATILRKGAVEYNPLFGLRNVPRDIGSSIFYTKHGYNPFHFISGAKSYLGTDITFQKFLASGAAQSYLVGMDRHLEIGKNSIYAHPSYRSQKGWNPNYLNPFRYFKKFNSFTETANRVGGFVNALNKTGDVWLAMAEGRSIAADYGLRGASMRNAGALWPFLNARIQHTKQFGIAFQPENIAKTITKGAIYYSAPTMANWMYWHSSEELADRYAELPYWRKYGFFNVPIPGSQFTFSLPTGGFGYVFGKGPETMMNYLNDPNFGSKEIMQSLLSGWEQIFPVGGGGKGFASDILPYGAQVIAENIIGYDFFTGRNIIPRAMEHLAAEAQYDESTPVPLRWIGEKIGVSPKRLQHLVSSVFAGSGDFTMDVLDDLAVATGISDARYATWTKLSDFPFMRAFVSQNPYLGKQGLSYQKMWESLDELNRVDNTVNKWISTEQLNAGGPTARMELLKNKEVSQQVHKFLSKGDNLRKYQWLHTEFETTSLDDSGMPKMTSNSKQIRKFHDLVKLIGDVNLMAMKEKGYLTDEPMSIDFQRLWKNMSKEDQADYRGNEKLISGQDIIFRNNIVITDITRQLNEAIESGSDFELNRSLLVIDEVLKKWMYDMPMKFHTQDIKEQILKR